jgi:hypothetical protein
VLLAQVQDVAASEADRLRALHALGPRRDRATLVALVDLLPEVRLRPVIVNGQRFALRQGEGSIALSLPRAERETCPLELSASPGACFSRFRRRSARSGRPPPAPEE